MKSDVGSFVPDPQISLTSLRLSLMGEDPAHLDAERVEEIVLGAVQDDWDEFQDDEVDVNIEDAWNEYVEWSSTWPEEKHDENRPHDDRSIIVLDDENFRFFRTIGLRTLLAGMLVQSIRDMAFLEQARSRPDFQERSGKDFEEIRASAQWLDTQEGRMAIKMLFSDFPQDEFVKRVKADPEGMLRRFDIWSAAASSSDKLTPEAHVAENQESAYRMSCS